MLRGVTETTEPQDVVRQAVAAATSGPARLRELCDGLDPKDCVRKPGVGKLSLFEHVRHLLDMERDVFGPRLRRVLVGAPRPTVVSASCKLCYKPSV